MFPLGPLVKSYPDPEKACSGTVLFFFFSAKYLSDDRAPTDSPRSENRDPVSSKLVSKLPDSNLSFFFSAISQSKDRTPTE